MILSTKTLAPCCECLLQVKPKALGDLSLDVPSGSKTSKVGSLERKHASYDVWYLGDDPNDAVGGEEVKNLSVLVPRAKKGGKLYTGKQTCKPRAFLTV